MKSILILVVSVTFLWGCGGKPSPAPEFTKLSPYSIALIDGSEITITAYYCETFDNDNDPSPWINVHCWGDIDDGYGYIFEGVIRSYRLKE